MAIAAGLQVTEILDAALLAFRKKIIPIRLFANAWRKNQAPLKKGGTMAVPYYPLETVASTDFVAANGYVLPNGPNAETREITVNKRKYQPLVTTSAELARYNFDPVQLGKMKGNKLATDVVTDILSLVTLANYGAAAFTGLASTFDADDVADLQLACDLANWPAEMRGLILASAYNTALVKDNAIQAEYASGTTDPLYEGRMPRLNGFDVTPSNEVPANAQNLVGMAVYPSAILVGFSPIEPAPAVREQLMAYEVVEDPETGIFLEYRKWGNAQMDAEYEVIECNYGYVKGEAEAIKRMVSA
ncbi:MAG: hypothetical protein V4819_19215 [Verrucomicrobiota bacterium]